MPKPNKVNTYYTCIVDAQEGAENELKHSTSFM